MIIDDSVSFFGVYYHNCIFHLNLSKEFADLYSKEKYRNVILCQKDEKNGYLMTQSIMSAQSVNPYIQSYYYNNIEDLKHGFKKIINKMSSSEKTFYLVRTSTSKDIRDSEKILKKWKAEVKKNLT